MVRPVKKRNISGLRVSCNAWPKPAYCLLGECRDFTVMSMLCESSDQRVLRKRIQKEDRVWPPPDRAAHVLASTSSHDLGQGLNVDGYGARAFGTSKRCVSRLTSTGTIGLVPDLDSSRLCGLH